MKYIFAILAMWIGACLPSSASSLKNIDEKGSFYINQFRTPTHFEIKRTTPSGTVETKVVKLMYVDKVYSGFEDKVVKELERFSDSGLQLLKQQRYSNGDFRAHLMASNGVDLSLYLLRKGWVSAQKDNESQKASSAYYKDAERYAKNRKVGFWSTN